MKVTIRPLIMDDLSALVQCANHPSIGGYLSNRFSYPYTKEAGLGYLRICAQADCREMLAYAILVDDVFAGCIGVDKQRDVNSHNGSLGYWLGIDFWGKGIATRAVACMIQEAFQIQDITRIYAEVFEPNKASARVLLKNGFQQVGHFHQSILKNDQVMDCLVFEIHK